MQPQHDLRRQKPPDAPAAAPPARARRRPARPSPRAPLTALWLLAAAGLAALEWDAGPPAARAQVAVTACTDANPTLVTTLFVPRRQPDQPAVVTFRDTPGNTGRGVLATQDQVGAAYGLAFDVAAQQLYAAAYVKRGAPLGPLGPGGIYRIAPASGRVEPWRVVPDVGPDPHDPAGDHWPDDAARDHVGRVGLGDIDLDEAGRLLFVMNLTDRRIYRFRTADAGLEGSFPHGAATEAWAAEARPFGLGVRGGRVYHGLVNSQSRTVSPGRLAAYVYSSLPDGADMRQEATFDLDYNRGEAIGGVGAGWRPWRDGFQNANPRLGLSAVYPQPMLSDIVFTDDGDIVLGLRDRQGDMTWFQSPNPPGESHGLAAGDILLGERTASGWDVRPWPEFFAQDFGPGLDRPDPPHDEVSFGGLARLPALDVVAMTGLAPERSHSGGGFWFDGGAGRNVAREELYHFHDTPLLNYGKANGLGDLEVLCLGAPSPTPTPTDTPLPSSTPTVTATATATPAPRPPAPIFLPYAGADRCIPSQRAADIVLVIDTSSSMTAATSPGGPTKVEAARQAALRFVELMDLRRDHVALVTFDDAARVRIGLTGDGPALHGALAALPTARGTRIDAGLDAARLELHGPRRRAEANGVILALTDGRPTSSSAADAVAAAEAAKRAGAAVFTIGLGPDVDPVLLTRLATSEQNFYPAPGAEDLARVYAAVAGAMPCP